MDVMYERCSGLDIHKKMIVACVIVPGAKREPHKMLRTFGTVTEDLMLLREWLADNAVTCVAMESTGSYWKPVFNMLEEHFELLLANARQLRSVPGRKTDVKDAEWIADLLRHGLLKASFVPGRAQRELRELVRYRTSLTQERTAAANRLQKVLEGANIKLASVASNILGRSGREMLSALVGGESDPAVLADLAQGKLRHKLAELQRALLGQFGAHQRFMVAEILAHIDFLEERIESLNQEIAERERPFDEALHLLDTIPGIGPRIAETLIAELGGDDVGRFASARHLASWVGVCPGQNESAGKQRSGTTRKGNRWLRSVLVEAAYAAKRSKDTYLSAQFARIAARRGVKKAAVAVAHSILVIVYHLLSERHEYLDLGPTYFDQRDRSRVTRRLQARLERLGYVVQLEPAPSAA